MGVAVGELDKMPKISIEGKGVLKRGMWADQVDTGVVIVAAGRGFVPPRGHRVLGMWSSERSSGLVRDDEAFNGCSRNSGTTVW